MNINELLIDQHTCVKVNTKQRRRQALSKVEAQLVMLLSFIFYSIKLHVDGRGPHVAPAEAFDSKFRSNLTLALGTGAALVGV